MPRQKRFAGKKVQLRVIPKGEKFLIRRLIAFGISKKWRPVSNFQAAISRVKSLKVVGLREFWQTKLAAAMKKIGKLVLNLLWFVFLTLLTQIGGCLWLLAVGLGRGLRGRVKLRFLNGSIFTLLYLVATLFVVPTVARKFGRVPLPVFANPYLKPENLLFALFNRHYVRPELRRSLEEAALQMQARYPGAIVWYMDANFPFIDGYPLEPHFSHRDGKKVDIAFYWKDKASGKTLSGTPSPIGYGACAEPMPGEYDYAADCESKGYWYISMDKTLAEAFFNKNQYVFDVNMTSELARLLAENQDVGKILIQTHLEKRMRLERYDKFRQQGCKAARHDDHFHVQL